LTTVFTAGRSTDAGLDESALAATSGIWAIPAEFADPD
jgi:hypothetical protein